AADAPGYGGADAGPAEGRCRGPNRPASQGAVCRGELAADATHRAPVSARRRVDRAPPEERADLEGAREKARLAPKLIAETCARRPATPPAPSPPLPPPPPMPTAAPQGRAPDHRRSTLRVLGCLLTILSKRRERGEDPLMRLT